MTEVREITELYRLEKVLKSSTAGVVFRAVDPSSGGRVAIKLINRGPEEDQEACQESFLRTIGAVKTAPVKCLPQILDFGLTPDGSAFLVMSHFPGEPLDTLAGASPSRVLPLMREVMDDLEVLAGLGLAHRNVAPDNLALARAAGLERLVLYGFGTVAFRGHEAAGPFCAPELCAEGGTSAADWRSDLFSASMVLCHVLRARIVPPDSATPEVELTAETVAGLGDPERLRAVLAKALRHARDQRPGSWPEVRDALAAALAPPSLESLETERTRQIRIGDVLPTPSTGGGEPPHGGDAPAAADAARLAAVEEQERLALEAAGIGEADLENAFSGEPEVVALEPVGEPEEPTIDEARGEAPEAIGPPLELDPEVPDVERPGFDEPGQSGTPAVTVEPVSSFAAAGHAPGRQDGDPFDTNSVSRARIEKTMAISIAEPQAEGGGHAESVEAPDLELDYQPPQPSVQTAKIDVRSATAQPPTEPAAPVAPPPARTADRGVPASAISRTMRIEVAADGSVSTGEATAVMDLQPVEQQVSGSAIELEPTVADRAAATATETTRVDARGDAPDSATGADVIAAGQATAPTASVPGPAQPPAPPKPAPGTRARAAGTGVPRWVIVVVAAVGLALIVGGSLILAARLLGGRSRQPIATQVVPTLPPAAPTALPEPTPLPYAVRQLVLAEEQAAAGDWNEARKTIEALTASDLDLLSGDEHERYRALQDALDLRRQGAIARDLDRAMASGNLDALRRVVNSVGRVDRSQLPSGAEFQEKLSAARAALDAYSAMTRAQAEKAPLDVIRHATALLSRVPSAGVAVAARNSAAEALEIEADRLAATGDTRGGLARLEGLAGVWPDRAGLDRRLERLRDEREYDARVNAMLDKAEAQGRANRPEKGLEMIDAAPIRKRWEARAREVRAALAAQLASVDGAPPSVTIKPGTKLEFDKGKPGFVQLRITDDHGIKDVTATARPQGGSWQKLTVRNVAAGEYVVEIEVGLHGNEPVDLWVEAVDFSGHSGRLGSEQQPVVVKRNRWLF